MDLEPRLPEWPTFGREPDLSPEAVDVKLPTTLSLDEAFRAAFYLVERYLAVEDQPSDDLVLFMQYMRSDPARLGDWMNSVRRALTDGGAANGYMHLEQGGIES
ncbi:hypothetical protein [Pseudolysinimonas sp.]|jgi:hypothetical protein|uniref:hypothetical protein n=1 Tax=Pseudolysinimonas sp. TaxID=2680009 RepID=UPI00378458CF